MTVDLTPKFNFISSAEELIPAVNNSLSDFLGGQVLNTPLKVIQNHIESSDFLTGTSGWRINANGDVEFNSGVFRGTLSAVTGTFDSIYTNAENGLTVDYGGSILLKEGGNINFTSVVTPTACTAALIEVAGNVDTGTHSYKVTYVNASGETELGAVSNTVTTDGTHEQVALTGIPVSTSLSVTSRKIYRTKAGGVEYYLLATISDNTTTTYTDNIADTSLGSYIADLLPNTTAGRLYVDDITILTANISDVLVGINASSTTNTGYANSILGAEALKNNTTGNNNTGIGNKCLITNTAGNYNVAVGAGSLYDNSTGSNNIALGYLAGYYETGSNTFYVNNQDRTNTAGDKSLSILYGVMAAAAADQKLTINALLNVSVSKTPASASATGTAGDIAWDADYIYVCTATDTWKRVAIATW